MSWLKKHLGSHLEQLALFAIPSSFNEESKSDVESYGAQGGTSSKLSEEVGSNSRASATGSSFIQRFENSQETQMRREDDDLATWLSTTDPPEDLMEAET